MLSLLWSNLSMWGHFLIVLNLRKPNPPSIWLCWLTSIQIEQLWPEQWRKLQSGPACQSQVQLQPAGRRQSGEDGTQLDQGAWAEDVQDQDRGRVQADPGCRQLQSLRQSDYQRLWELGQWGEVSMGHYRLQMEYINIYGLLQTPGGVRR